MTTPVTDGEADEVDRIAAAVMTAPGVVKLGGGGLRQPVTYLTGRRVEGVRVSAHCVEVAVVAQFGIPAPELGKRIRKVVTPLTNGRAIDVLIADVQLPDEVDAAGQRDVGSDVGSRSSSSPTIP